MVIAPDNGLHLFATAKNKKFERKISMSSTNFKVGTSLSQNFKNLLNLFFCILNFLERQGIVTL